MRAIKGSPGCDAMTSTDVEALFDRAAKRLRGVERGKMLSASGLRDPAASPADGTACAEYMREARKFVSG
jgi:hypothetical protein